MSVDVEYSFAKPKRIFQFHPIFGVIICLVLGSHMIPNG